MTLGMKTGTVLVVDDEETIRNAVIEALSGEGYDVTGSPCASDAITKIVQSRFDVALIDILMPDLSGFDLIRVMGKLCPETILIVLTAMQDTENRFSKTAESSGVFAYMQKPWRFDALNDIVQKALGYKLSSETVRELAGAK